MIKCPYCGSTAQPRLVGSSECNGVVVEIYTCGCGAKTEKVYQRVEDRVWSASGTLIKRVRY